MTWVKAQWNDRGKEKETKQGSWDGGQQSNSKEENQAAQGVRGGKKAQIHSQMR